MKELQVFDFNNVNVVDSRAVAEMIGKTHAHLMRDIGNYVKVLSESAESNFGLSDFFISSSYKDSTGRTLPCYLLTKKGCDMVANKMTGKRHDHLIRDIKNYCDILVRNNAPRFGVVDSSGGQPKSGESDYEQILEKSNESNFGLVDSTDEISQRKFVSSDFFIESTYTIVRMS